MSRRWVPVVLLAPVVAAALFPSRPFLSSPARAQNGEPLRLHHIQVLGSHNSYKEALSPSLFELYAKERPETVRGLDYHHVSLTRQLELGLRKLELDVFHDPQGGRYAQPGGLRWVAEAGLPPGPPYDPRGEMKAPGFKVLHVQDLDFRSSCLTLRSCLDELRAWSQAHPRHLPVVVTLNAKDGVIPRPGFVEPLPFDAAAFDALDRALVQGLGRKRLLLPDDVRGEADSLEEVILERGWPLLEETRGRFLFVLDEGGEKLATYIAGHPALRGRTLFVNAPEGTPEAAFRIVNDPIRRGEDIRRLVARGYLVRTRADADTREARSGNTERRDAAFASGAHFISTDYYLENPKLATGYRVRLPGGGVARCNPVTTSKACSLEE